MGMPFYGQGKQSNVDSSSNPPFLPMISVAAVFAISLWGDVDNETVVEGVPAYNVVDKLHCKVR